MNRRRFLGVAAVLTGCSTALVGEMRAAPTPISACGGLGKGSYVLTKNLTAAGDCLRLLGNYITVDLAGFVISGDGTGSGIKASTAGISGINIRNGTITNFATGISTLNATGVLIEEVRVIKNKGNGILLGTGSTARNNLAEDNGGTGISLGAGSLASGNLARLNAGNGISLGKDGAATGNTSYDNGGWGMIADNGSTVAENTAGDNGNDGLSVGFGTTITRNTVRSNTGAGIRVLCPSNLIGNTATSNVGGSRVVGAGSGCFESQNLFP